MEHLTTLTGSARRVFNARCHLGAYAFSRIASSATTECVLIHESVCVLTLISVNKPQLAMSATLHASLHSPKLTMPSSYTNQHAKQTVLSKTCSLLKSKTAQILNPRESDNLVTESPMSTDGG